MFAVTISSAEWMGAPLKKKEKKSKSSLFPAPKIEGLKPKQSENPNKALLGPTAFHYSFVEIENIIIMFSAEDIQTNIVTCSFGVITEGLVPGTSFCRLWPPELDPHSPGGGDIDSLSGQNERQRKGKSN